MLLEGQFCLHFISTFDIPGWRPLSIRDPPLRRTLSHVWAAIYMVDLQRWGLLTKINHLFKKKMFQKNKTIKSNQILSKQLSMESIPKATRRPHLDCYVLQLTVERVVWNKIPQEIQTFQKHNFGNSGFLLKVEINC